MDKDSFQSFLKQTLATFYEPRLKDLMDKDIDFQHSRKRVRVAEDSYMNIENCLTDSQKLIISELVDSIEENNYLAMDLAYLQGLMDAYTFTSSYISPIPQNPLKKFSRIPD